MRTGTRDCFPVRTGGREKHRQLFSSFLLPSPFVIFNTLLCSQGRQFAGPGCHFSAHPRFSFHSPQSPFPSIREQVLPAGRCPASGKGPVFLLPQFRTKTNRTFAPAPPNRSHYPDIRDVRIAGGYPPAAGSPFPLFSPGNRVHGKAFLLFRCQADPPQDAAKNLFIQDRPPPTVS